MTSKDILLEENRLKILKSYFDTYGLVKHQIEPFDHFIFYGIKSIIDDEADIVFKVKIIDKTVIISLKLENVYVAEPTYIDVNRIVKPLFPLRARESMMTYDSIIYVDILEYHDNVFQKKYIRIPISRIPMMVKSAKCNLSRLKSSELYSKGEIEDDPGGYFIINGNERVLVGQIRNAYNMFICFRPKKSEPLLCEMRSMSDETGHSVFISLRLNFDKTITLCTPKFKHSINIGDVFKILDRHPKNFVLDSEDERSPSFIEEELKYEQYLSVMSPSGEVIDNKYKVFILNDMFPHLGMNSNADEKAILLGKMIRKLILTDAGVLSEENKDTYSNKRLEMSGMLCLELFKLLYKRFIKTCIGQLEKRKRADFMDCLISNNVITSGLLFSFCTGNWGVQKNNYIRFGVSLNIYPKPQYGTMLSYLRRCNIPLGKEGKNTKIRQIHPSSIFFMCPSETPEGQTVGMALNLSMLASVSLKYSSVTIQEIIVKECKQFISLSVPPALSKILVCINGCIYGYTLDGAALIDEISELKYNMKIPYDVSCTLTKELGMVNIHCDAGRLIRPLFDLSYVPESVASFSSYFKKKNRFIKFLDAYEIEQTSIAIDINSILRNSGADKANPLRSTFQYMEFHPACIMGVMAVQIPYSNFTQSPRVCYQSSMAKQAIGYLMACNMRCDGTMHIQPYVQKPIVTTSIANMIKVNEYPTGLNAIVAIACYTGFNQEDSIILNKASIERGLFNCFTYRVIEIQIKSVNSIEHIICLPNVSIRNHKNNYDHLDSKGVVKLRSEVKINDVVIGKICRDKTTGIDTDQSVVVKIGEEGRIERIIENKQYNIIKIVILQSKIPEIGDKFCSGMAQKGTCGIILDERDMPFTNQGMCPDMIINPHAIPSRMTVNQIMACVQGKICCVSGDLSYSNASPFKEGPSKSHGPPDGERGVLYELCEKLNFLGYNHDGTETMYNGMTGYKLRYKIFIGPTYYHRLSHMVSDKIFARGLGGPINSLTHQPVNGRANNGGLRIGEMEKDCMLVHGVSKFLHEKMFDHSDKFILKQCNECEQYSNVVYGPGSAGTWESSEARPFYFCKVCKSTNISYFNLPYAAKLLCQELNAMGIKTKLK